MLSRLELFDSDLRVTTFLTGNSAVETIRRKTPDIVFLDYYLSSNAKENPDGDKVLKTIKKIAPDLPVVLLTGLTDTKKINDLLKTGFDGFIHKSEENLIENILQCISKYTKGRLQSSR